MSDREEGNISSKRVNETKKLPDERGHKHRKDKVSFFILKYVCYKILCRNSYSLNDIKTCKFMPFSLLSINNNKQYC